MSKLKTAVWRSLFVLAVLGFPIVACQGPEVFYRTVAGEGGSFGTGGSVVMGSGGATATGGTTGTGGISTGGTPGTGGTPATGGTTGTGGKGTGGAPATGGTTGTGGKGTGGTPATGGTTGTGGTPATGGTTGTGGKGTGGTTGTGGTAATGGTTGTGGTAATGLVVVDTDCQSATSVQSIGLYLDVLNTSAAAIPLSQITFRYYFQVAETSDPPHLDVDYSTTVPGADITAKFAAITPALTGANEYMEVGFTAAAGSLAAQSDTAQIQLRVHATSYASPFDSTQATDYSFQPCTGTRMANTGAFTQQTTITAYVKGVLASGVEPQ